MEEFWREEIIEGHKFEHNPQNKLCSVNWQTCKPLQNSRSKKILPIQNMYFLGFK